MNARLPRLVLPPLLALVAGCGRCSSSTDADAGSQGSASSPGARSPESAHLEGVLPPPKPLTFSKLRGLTSVALPNHCALRAPIVEASLSSTTRVVAEPRSPGTLIIADSEGDPPTLTGVAALTLDPAGPTRDPKPIPWLDAGSLPRLARAAKGGWLAAIERPTEGTALRVDLWRSSSLDAIGEGDRFEAMDLACGEARCALLTSRLGKVAAAGAEAWIGGPDDPGASWRRIQLPPSSAESDARPLSLASVEPDVVAALSEKGSCVLQIAGDPRRPSRDREAARAPRRARRDHGPRSDGDDVRDGRRRGRLRGPWIERQRPGAGCRDGYR